MSNRETVDHLQVRIWRGLAKPGSWQQFIVPAQDNQTILDVVTWIQKNQDPGLSYRFACRVGMCGSCAMMVNDEPRWTCRTHVKQAVNGNRLDIGPLQNLPVVKDLVCDMDPFFDKWKQAWGEFQGSKTRADAIEPIDPESTQRQAADAAVQCINCAVCYAACDVVNWNPEYLGPAALNRAWTLMNDQRDQAGQVRLQAIAADAGCHNCHAHQSCARYCPNELNPTASIAGLKRMSSIALLNGDI